MTTPAPTRQHAETATRLRLALVRLSRQFRRHNVEGLTPSQWSALSTLDAHGRMRIGDLADREGVSAPTATRVVASLEQVGLVDREGDPDDRRSSRISLSRGGVTALEALRTVRDQRLAMAIAHLPPEDADRLAAAVPALEALAAAVSEVPGE